MMVILSSTILIIVFRAQITMVGKRKEGWISKQSKWMHIWKRRYCVVTDTELYFSKDPDHPPHIVIDLRNIEIVEKSRVRGFNVRTKYDGTFYCCSDTSNGRDEWIHFISCVMVAESKVKKVITVSSNLNILPRSVYHDLFQRWSEYKDMVYLFVFFKKIPPRKLFSYIIVTTCSTKDIGRKFEYF